jgi:hypothetical protein
MQISAEKGRILKLEEEKETMHRKVVKYQDLVHGMVHALCDVSSEINIIEGQEMEELLQKSTTENLKLTIGLKEIDALFECIDNLDIKEKLKEFRKVKNKMEDSI